MKTTIKGFVTYRQDHFGKDEFDFFPFEMTGSGRILVMPHSFEVEIPDDFDPREKQVEALRAEKKKLMAEFQARCTEIEKQISQLTALTCEVTV